MRVPLDRLSLLFTLLVIAGIVVFASACRSRSGDSDAASGDRAPTQDTAAASASPTGTTHAVATVTPGVSQGEIKTGPLTRTFRLFVPAGLPASGAPLVVALHGGLGNPEQFAATTRFDELATAERFVVVYPAGIESTWNGGACCGRAAAQKVDDVAFLAALIAQLKAQVPIDSRKVFITGHSNGAIMAFRFACERADMVAGIVPVAGSLEIPACTPSRTVPLLAIHGDADRNHPFEGGEGPRSIAGVAFRSMPDSLAMWAKAMGCAAGPEKQGPGVVMTWHWAGCRDNVSTGMIVIAGADHPWPSSTGPRFSALQGEPTKALDASKEAWRFFASLGK